MLDNDNIMILNAEAVVNIPIDEKCFHRCS